MRSSLLRGLAAPCLLAGVALPCPAAQTILQRVHPTRARWGEVSIAEARLVTLPLRGDEVEHPWALALAFRERDRRQELSALVEGSGEPTSGTAPVGFIRIAADTGEGPEGRGAWLEFRERLEGLLRRLGPGGYEAFITEFGGWLRRDIAADGPAGSTSIVFCAELPGGPSTAGEARGVAEATSTGETLRSSGYTTFSDPRPICAALENAFAAISPEEVVTTALLVEEVLEERLVFAGLARRDAPVAPLPAGASVSREDLPDGVDSMHRTSRREATSRAEESRGPAGGRRSESPATQGQPFLLVTEAAPAAIAPDAVSRRGLLGRWTISTTGRRLGVNPAVLHEDRRELLTAVLLATDRGFVSEEDWASATARALEPIPGLLGVELLSQALRHALAPAAPEESVLVTCLPVRGGFEADYCLARACADVTNPQEFCRALGAAIPE